MRRRGVAWMALIVLALAAPAALAQGPVLVGVVVQESEASVRTYCVALDAADPTGYDALLQAGPAIQASVTAQGVAVCQIGETGCPANDCFCRCRGAACTYWAYSHLRDGYWQTANVGAAGHRVSYGDVEGWRWGGGEAPPVIPFEEICTGTSAAPSSAQAPAGQPAASKRAPSALVPVAVAGAATALALALTRKRRGGG